MVYLKENFLIILNFLFVHSVFSAYRLDVLNDHDNRIDTIRIFKIEEKILLNS